MKTILHGFWVIILGGITSFLGDEYIRPLVNKIKTQLETIMDDRNISMREKQDWLACKNNESLEKCNDYLKHYRNGHYATDADKRKQEIEDAIKAKIDAKIKAENAK